VNLGLLEAHPRRDAPDAGHAIVAAARATDGHAAGIPGLQLAT
jgi:hypothetical protein